ncbi:hypothetical protein BH10PSE2_BH10PSE2_30370 [soil metagenome]
MLTSTLRAQHTCLLDQATRLGGIVSASQTSDTTRRARLLLLEIDGMLVDHLTIEDEWLYPTLMASPDPRVQSQAAGYAEDMGGILGAWIAYRTQWEEAAISANFDRFRIATSGIIGALAVRIERENVDLYPAMDRLLQDADRIATAA